MVNTFVGMVNVMGKPVKAVQPSLELALLSASVPADIVGSGKHEFRHILERAGFYFGDTPQGGMVSASLPAGWQIVQRAESGGRDFSLLDANGSMRAYIHTVKHSTFLRGTQAYMLPYTRLTPHIELCHKGCGFVFAKITDYYKSEKGLTIHVLDPVEVTDALSWQKAGDIAWKSAKDWLDRNFPDWHRLDCYWEA